MSKQSWIHVAEFASHDAQGFVGYQGNRNLVSIKHLCPQKGGILRRGTPRHLFQVTWCYHFKIRGSFSVLLRYFRCNYVRVHSSIKGAREDDRTADGQSPGEWIYAAH